MRKKWNERGAGQRRKIEGSKIVRYKMTGTKGNKRRMKGGGR
jgi:hypothetical protein